VRRPAARIANVDDGRGFDAKADDGVYGAVPFSAQATIAVT
jgi:hypothetical protein